jgi:hypothetical protein
LAMTLETEPEIPTSQGDEMDASFSFYRFK